jgi:two-component system, NarL family, nitrate/nitrite response regulator NarL
MSESTQNPIRILLVDDHQSFLWGLVKLIESDGPGMKVIGTASDMLEALVIAERENPDVILLDIDLHGVSSLESMPALLKVTKSSVLILTGLRDMKIRDRAMLSGARGVVQKEESAEVILKAIKCVDRGEIWLDRVSTGRIFTKLLNPLNGEDSPEAARIASLTPRERQIIDVIITHGRSTNKEIAGHLNMSEHTLRNHLTSVYGKLEVENRLELVMYALKHGLSKTSG